HRNQEAATSNCPNGRRLSSPMLGSPDPPGRASNVRVGTGLSTGHIGSTGRVGTGLTSGHLGFQRQCGFPPAMWGRAPSPVRSSEARHPLTTNNAPCRSPLVLHWEQSSPETQSSARLSSGVPLTVPRSSNLSSDTDVRPPAHLLPL